MKLKSLRDFKESKGLTNKQLAVFLGISEIYALQLVAGRCPGRKLALRISEKTGIPAINLLYPPDSGQAEARG